MPWTTSDVDSHVKGLSAKQKRAWVHIANGMLKACRSRGGSDCDAHAIRGANSAAQRVGEAATDDDVYAIIVEAMRLEDSFSGIRDKVQRVLWARYQEAGLWPSIRDVWPDYVVYEVGDSTFQCSYSISGDDVELGEPEQVDLVYARTDGHSYAERYISPDERKKVPERDCAGKDGSFPIITPEDVAAAAHSIGRAGPGNYAPDELKRRIIAIARRKGASFIAKLPDSWKDGGSKESADLDAFDGDVFDLTEQAVSPRDGTIGMRIIGPGQGATGYYTEEVLKRDGPKVFVKGTQMLWDHPTEREEAGRPEGSLRSLAGELVEDAHWDGSHASGPGLFARAKIFEPFRSAVDELAPHIGVSIRARGVGRLGQVSGKPTKIVEELVKAKSVDFVTKAGAGGKVLQLFEAARSRPNITEEEVEMDQKEIQALQDAKTALEAQVRTLADADKVRVIEIDRLREAVQIRDAKEILTAALAKEELSDRTRARLTESLLKGVPLRDGKTDAEAFGVRIKEAVAAEVAYLAEAAGGVRGMGTSKAVASSATDLAGAEKEIAANLERITGIKREVAK